MPLPGNANKIVVRFSWFNARTGAGVTTPVTFDPVPLTGTTTPNVTDLAAFAWIKTQQETVTPNVSTGYAAVALLANDDPDLTAFGGWRVTPQGEPPFVIAVSVDSPTVTVDAAMKTAIPSLVVGEQVQAMWLTEAALVGVVPPPPPETWLTAGQTVSTLASAISEHDVDPDAHQDIRDLIEAGGSVTVPDATTGTKGQARILGGTADAPTVPYSAVTGAPASLPPNGGAGGVLGGTYPNPSFAVDMATQAELDTGLAGKASTSALTSGLAAKADLVGGKVPDAQIPAVAVADFLGAVATQAAMLALAGQRGDWCTRTDLGTDWQLIAEPSTTLASWREHVYPGSPVQSVAGRTGAVTLAKGDVGLGSVDNTADAAKPVSTAQQTALDAKAPLASPAFTGTPTGITKTHVGLGNVDNTADSSKPVSTAQQTALDAKATTSALTAHTGSTANPHSVTKAQVGLGSVDNTADTAKPVSTAQQTALDGKAAASHTHTAANITDFTEAAQDAVAAMLAQGTNVTLTYNDAANTLTVAATGGGAGLDAEAVRDAIGVAMVGAAPISVAVNDAADTITISTTATANSTDAALRDRSTHTGTQSADTLTDGTTNKTFLATERTKLTGVATGATANSADATLLARANHTGSQAISTVTGLQTALDAKTALTVDGVATATYDIDTTPVTPADIGAQPVDSDLTAIAALAAANNDVVQRKAGVWTNRTPAQLKTDLAVSYADLSGTVPTAALPPLAINETFAPANQAAMLALTAQRGDMAVRADNGRTYVLASDSPATLADWKEVLAAGQVQSVAGQTGVVTLTKSDVGLGNVTNTAQVTGVTAADATITIGGTATAPTVAVGTGLAQSKVTNLTTDLAAKQPLDTDLTTIAGLTATTDSFLQSKASAWTTRTPAQVAADLQGTTSTTLAAGNDVRFTTVTANTQTASYTLVLADAGKAVEMNSASANTLTIPPNSSVAFPVGTVIEVFQLGAGQTTVTAGAGVTLRAPDGAKTSKQYASGSLRKRATDEWVLAGSTAP